MLLTLFRSGSFSDTDVSDHVTALLRALHGSPPPAEQDSSSLPCCLRLSTSVPPLPLPHSQPHLTHLVYPPTLDSWVSDQGSCSLLHAFMCPVPCPQDVLFLSYMNWLMVYPVLLGRLRNPAILPTAGSISPLPSTAFYLISLSDVLVRINFSFLSNPMVFC